MFSDSRTRIIALRFCLSMILFFALATTAPTSAQIPSIDSTPSPDLQIPSLSPDAATPTPAAVEPSVPDASASEPTEVITPTPAPPELDAPTSPDLSGEKMPHLEAIPDPHETLNRGTFAFDKGFLKAIGLPTAHGYQYLFRPEPMRKSIQKMGDNLGWPVRFFNTMFQGKFIGTGVETSRFLINTTVGVLGLFDPAKHMGLHPYKVDFGQTLAFYGSGTGSYYVLPFLGPNSRRDTIGWFFDTILNPTTYIPGAGILFNINTLSLHTDVIEREMKMEKDLYPLARDIWALNREKNVTDYQIIDSEGERTQTLEAIFLNVSDPTFVKEAKERKVLIKSTGKKLPYSYWMQTRQAPLVFVLPGVGSSRLSGGSMALAEMVYRNGFSVVLISNALNWEFMENAGTSAVPGYTPSDARDIYKALNAIYLDLNRQHPNTFHSTALMGISLGALHTLCISSQLESGPVSELRFDRYLAVNPPVDLPYALQKLDEFYNAPLKWSEEERDKKIDNTLLKAIKLSERNLTPSSISLFNPTEAEFLIGLNFKLILRDILYSSQSRGNMGVLTSNLNQVRRNGAYQEMMGFSYSEYLAKFVVPYVMRKTNGTMTREELLASASMPAIEQDLKKNSKVRIYLNENDFLLQPQDIAWLKSVMGDDRLHVFKEGGHLGNLYQVKVQNRIVAPLEDLKEKM